MSTPFHALPKNASSEEARFDADEMVVSTTDRRGIIVSSNDAFSRVSGFSKGILVGSPHSVVRHPDMPKCIFRILWRNLESEKPFFGYLKNKTSDGRSYWVFSTVVPVRDRCLSIQIKPSSGFFDSIKGLYRNILIEESRNGVDAGLSILLTFLKVNGFVDYESFMNRALNEEMVSRDLSGSISFSGNEEVSRKSSLVGSMRRIAKESESDLKIAYESFSKIQESHSAFSGITSKIFKQSEQLEYLSLNMSVMANKLGKEGPTLTMVSAAFQKSSKEIFDRFQRFGVCVSDVIEATQKLRDTLALTRLQVEMQTFVLKELDSAGKSESNSTIVLEEIGPLTTIVKILFDRLLDHQEQGIQKLKEFRRLTTAVRNIVVSLDLIRMGGRLEGARTEKTEEVFTPYVNQMIECIEAIGNPVAEVIEITEQMIKEFTANHLRLQEIGLQLVELELIPYRDYKCVANRVLKKEHLKAG